MARNYQEEKHIIDKSEEEIRTDIIIGIIKAKREFTNNCKNFEFASEKPLVDYYTYQIKASQSKLDYLINLAKEKGIAIDNIQESYIENYKVV